MPSRLCTVSTPHGDVPVTVAESGADGRPVLLLHGGAGPDSVTGFGDALAGRFPFRVLSPVYPGFGGTARPGWLDSISELALVLRGLLEDLYLTDVIVAGSSIGGWAATELALAAPERVGQLVLIDPAGLDSADHPSADFFSLTPDQLAELSWANPKGTASTRRRCPRHSGPSCSATGRPCWPTAASRWPIPPWPRGSAASPRRRS